MSKFIDFDPLRGMHMSMDYHHGDQTQHVHYKQDVEPTFELAGIERRDGLADATAKKNHKWGEEIYLYARIPPVIIYEMRFKHGVDIFKKDHMKKALELINTHYPKFKCTEKTHRLGKQVQVFT